MLGVVSELKILNASQAAILNSLMQVYYLNDIHFNSLVKVFNESPEKFDFHSLLKGVTKLEEK